MWPGLERLRRLLHQECTFTGLGLRSLSVSVRGSTITSDPNAWPWWGAAVATNRVEPGIARTSSSMLGRRARGPKLPCTVNVVPIDKHAPARALCQPVRRPPFQSSFGVSASLGASRLSTTSCRNGPRKSLMGARGTLHTSMPSSRRCIAKSPNCAQA